jgi:hypothetical protein
MCLPQKKGSHVAEALAELGRGGAVAHRPESQVSSRRRQVDSSTGELLPEDISYLEEMRRGLVNTQHRLRELKWREQERELKKKRRWEAQAARAAGNQPEEDGEPQVAKGSSGRTGRSVSRAARPHSCMARSQSRTGARTLLSSDVPEIPPVNMGELIPMVIKEEDIAANAAG